MPSIFPFSLTHLKCWTSKMINLGFFFVALVASTYSERKRQETRPVRERGKHAPKGHRPGVKPTTAAGTLQPPPQDPTTAPPGRPVDMQNLESLHCKKAFLRK